MSEVASLCPVCYSMKDEVIQLYLNNSAVVAAPREVCLLGALRCHGIGMIVGALGVSKEQLRDALLEGTDRLIFPLIIRQPRLSFL